MTNTNGFILETTRQIEGRDITVSSWRHASSGMRHVHLAKDDPELGFSLGFPTAPSNDTGVAHALEHMVLCGSRDFPVRDPFFNMLRRSMATYANAMTGADHTLYPFATIDRQDYWNLMDVYLDATFFPILDELDFRQEVVRLEVAQEGEQAGYDGVVFNEMVGALSSPQAFLFKAITNAVAPGSTYAMESGGDPEDIPNLTPQTLRDFHATHYHPAQALLLTYGNLDPEQVQAKLKERVLDRLEPRVAALTENIPATWPARVKTHIPQEEIRDNNHTWFKLWELPSASAGEILTSTIMAGVLLEEGQALPVALDNLGFGQRMACDVLRFGDTMALLVVMGDLTPQQMGIVEATVEQAIEAQIEQGAEAQLIEAKLQNLEMQQRAVTRGRSGPPGLRILNGIAGAWAWSQDIERGIDGIDLDRALKACEGHISPDSFKQWARNIQQNARSTIIEAAPDTEFFARRRQALSDRAQADDLALSPEDRQHAIEQSNALLARQRAPQDTSILPILDIRTISAEVPASATIQWADGAQGRAASAAVSVPLNGLLSLGVVFDISTLPISDRPWLSLFSDLWGSMAVGDMDWEETERWRSSLGGGLHTGGSARVSQQTGRFSQELGFLSTSLTRMENTIRPALVKAIREVKFDDPGRVTFLLQQSLIGMKNGLSQQGPGLAKRRAVRWLGEDKALNEDTDGIPYLSFMVAIEKKLAQEGGVKEIIDNLNRVHAWILEQPCCARTAEIHPWAAAVALSDELTWVKEGWASLERPGVIIENEDREPAQMAFVGQTDVNHTTQIFKGPPKRHEDEAAALVMTEIVSSQFLHSALREQGGAYGGGLSMGDSVLMFSSYRDPRLAETFADFARARDWLESVEITPTMLQEATLGAMAKINQPEAPGDMAIKSWERTIENLSDEDRRKFRERVLATTPEQIKAVGARWLDPAQPSSRTAFIGPAMVEQAQTMGLGITRLRDLLEVIPNPARAPAP